MAIKWQQGELDCIETFYRGGLSTQMLGSMFKTSNRTIAAILKKRGVTLRPKGGRNNYKGPIPAEELLTIHYKKLAKKYGVAEITIFKRRQEVQSANN